MAGLVPTTITATAANVSSLLGKLDNSDADFRFMGLNDLHHILTVGHPGVLSQEYNLANDVVDGVLKTLDDQNGEVQNLAVKWYADPKGRESWDETIEANLSFTSQAWALSWAGFHLRCWRSSSTGSRNSNSEIRWMTRSDQPRSGPSWPISPIRCPEWPRPKPSRMPIRPSVDT